MKRKQEVITFKVDEDLLKAIADIPNRSEFIRSAIMDALGSVCPLCKGTGTLTSNQRRHWEDFSVNHPVRDCQDCHERHLICLMERE